MVDAYYFDTYALIETGKGNPRYEPYKKDVKVLLNRLNLLELSYFLIKEGRGNETKDIFDKFSRFNVDYDEDVLLKSAEMKFKNLKHRISFIDCIGYNLAKKHNARFLTGDESFRDLEYVEFVK